MSEMLFQVQAPHFCAGLVVQDRQVVMAAPILRYMIGWNGQQFREYLNKKGWRYERVPVDPTPADSGD